MVVVVVVPALRNCRPETRAPHLTLPHRFSAFSGKYSGALVSDGIAYFIPSSASNVGTGFWRSQSGFFGINVCWDWCCSASVWFIQFMLLFATVAFLFLSVSGQSVWRTVSSPILILPVCSPFQF